MSSAASGDGASEPGPDGDGSDAAADDRGPGDGPPGPTRTRQRLPELDLLRGLALAGVILMNIPALAGWIYQNDTSLLEEVITVIAEGKFITIFSILFGYGAALQLSRSDGSARRRFWRRTIGLFVIGLLHGLLLYSGDILMIYALSGVVLLAFVRMPVRRLVRWAIISWAVGIGVLVGVGTLFALGERLDDDLATWVEDEVAEAVEVHAEGSFAEVVALRARELHPLVLVIYMPQTVAMFLLGMALMRSGLLHRRDVETERLLGRVGLWLIPLGLLVSWLAAEAADWIGGITEFVIGHSVMTTFAPLLALGYMAKLIQFHRKGWLGGAGERIQAVGRLALSNYLMHSLVLSFLFNGYGLGLYQQLPYWGLVLVTAALYALMMWWSPWWLARFRFGPAEWLLRSITYRQRQPLRR